MDQQAPKLDCGKFSTNCDQTCDYLRLTCDYLRCKPAAPSEHTSVSRRRRSRVSVPPRPRRPHTPIAGSIKALMKFWSSVLDCTACLGGVCPLLPAYLLFVSCCFFRSQRTNPGPGRLPSFGDGQLAGASEGAAAWSAYGMVGWLIVGL